MLGTKYGFGSSADFAAQTSDRRAAQQIRGSHIHAMRNKSVDLLAPGQRGLCVEDAGTGSSQV